MLAQNVGLSTIQYCVMTDGGGIISIHEHFHLHKANIKQYIFFLKKVKR